MKKISNFHDLISPLYPDLIISLKKFIENSEKEFLGNNSEGSESFLWEHTKHVASISLKLCISEKIDPIIPVTMALFHDSGKFFEGKYHVDEKPEEEDAVRVAAKMLADVGMTKAQIEEVTNSLAALYNENIKGDVISNIVHDADFLSKFGFIGTANFFMKSALRRKPLQNSILNSLSKELTYASCLPDNMRTISGRKLAEKKREESMNFFYGLLDELCESQIACYEVEKTRLKCNKTQDEIDVFVVIPSECGRCGGKFSRNFSREEGIKCEKLVCKVSCLNCSNNYRFSFCLPEISPSK